MDKKNQQLVHDIVNSPFGYTSILYFLTRGEVHNHEKLIKAMVEAAPNQAKQIMTAAAQIEEVGVKRGIELGMEKGMEKEKFNTAKNMLADHFDMSVIGKITGLSLDQINRLQQMY